MDKSITYIKDQLAIYNLNEPVCSQEHLLN